ncbi:MAG: DUF72 domain-containing protein [Acidobacteriota bacterium]
MAEARYHLGCPFWGFKDWVGNFYTDDARPQDYLPQYSSVFGTVEGNTTFYSLPAPETVERWREATPPTFRFSFKFPQTITHRAGLEGAGDATAEFLHRMEPLGERLGPFLLQLPPFFGPDRLGVLDRYLRSLPGDLELAVELRHRGFFAAGAMGPVDALLTARGAERAIMDTRALRSGDPNHPDVEAALHKKPDLPVVPAALGRHPYVRFVGHPDPEVNEPYVLELATAAASWIARGQVPYVMIHCPNNVHAPPLARRFHDLLSQQLDAGTLPVYPAHRGERRDGQLSMF